MDIVVFCYNRPEKLRMCLESINLSYADRLWIFCDGPSRPEHADAVKEAVEVAQRFPYSNKSVRIREINYGPPRNVITGLDEVFETTENCFILEDDCIVKPQAYAYIDWALKTFRDDKRIFSVNTMAPLNPFLNRLASIFVKDDIIACNRLHAFWGWATWADRWREFRPDLEPFKNPYGDAANTPFSFGGHIKYTLKLYEEGKAGGWDARLITLTAYKKKLHLHPKNSLMRNIGLDGTGLHFKSCQNTVNSYENLQFSDFVPRLSVKCYDRNRAIETLLMLNDLAIAMRSSLLSFLPLEVRMKIKKTISGNKKLQSQF